MRQSEMFQRDLDQIQTAYGGKHVCYRDGVQFSADDAGEVYRWAIKEFGIDGDYILSEVPVKTVYVPTCFPVGHEEDADKVTIPIMEPDITADPSVDGSVWAYEANSELKPDGVTVVAFDYSRPGMFVRFF